MTDERCTGSGERWSRRELLGAAGTGAAALAGGAGLGEGIAAADSEHGLKGARRGGNRAQVPRTIDSEPSAGAWIDLDRAALAANLAVVKAAAGGRPVMAVVLLSRTMLRVSERL